MNPKNNTDNVGLCSPAVPAAYQELISIYLFSLAEEGESLTQDTVAVQDDKSNSIEVVW